MWVDHIDTNPSNYKFTNLRLATPSQNRLNRLRKAKGWSFVNGRYRASIYIRGHNVQLGQYDTPEEATAAYQRKALEVYGPEFLNF